MSEAVNATPTKRFFVDMLTRDIELKDAILDLLDNCIDGIVRASPRSLAPSPDQPYSGYWAKIAISSESFSIVDNCNGIPRSIAKDNAFRMGRTDEGNDNSGTIGMYGIGMKRAIFKLGQSAIVRSRHDQEGFEVRITPEWLADPNSWTLSMSDRTSLDFAGTTIEVSQLNPEVRRAFQGNGKHFANELSRSIAQHFAVILEKGFSISVNGNEVLPQPVLVLISHRESDTGQIAPYLFSAAIDGVDVRIVAGLYRRLPTDSEIDDAGRRPSGTSRDAGWTIVCNDRVVVYRDRTMLTGWGEAGVPSYHPQFSSITGVVFLSSSDPSKLPLTTTKRGLEASSILYLTVKEVMRDATKTFTEFTYKWKNSSESLSQYYREAAAVEVQQAWSMIEEEAFSPSRKVKGGRTSIPELPKPKLASDNRVTVKFTKSRVEVELVAVGLFDDAKTKPAEVGRECFDLQLRRLQPSN